MLYRREPASPNSARATGGKETGEAEDMEKRAVGATDTEAEPEAG